MAIEIRNLRYLLSLSQRLNFARAAEDLGISQSALSRSVQTLEKQLGMRLFDRDRAGVSVTPTGRRIIERASHVIAEVADLERHLVLSAEAQAGRICFLPGVLADRLDHAPDVTHEVVVRDVEALWALLLANEIEFFVSQEGLIPDVSAARVELLGLFPLSLIVRPEHPLLLNAADEQTFPVVRASWAGLPLPQEAGIWARGASNIIEDFGALAAITQRSDAIWFSSSYAVAEELQAGTLAQLPWPDEGTAPEIRVVMYSLKRRSQSPLARVLKQTLRNKAHALAAFPQ
jgi:DNA-binding transcriptional LysR family regulator